MTNISFLNQKQATEFDVMMMSEDLGYLNEQLMELAGLSVACAVAEAYPLTSYPRVLVVVGPGNNGGDGMVASRHLVHFGYKPVIVYPKRPNKPLFQSLRKQNEHLGVQVLDKLPSELDKNFDVIIDSIFGYSFQAGTIRPPFDTIIQELNKTKIPIVAVDIPSGWDVDKGPTKEGLRADMLVSLTAPKLCAKGFKGRHFLGGRFVPPKIAEKLNIKLPAYEGTKQIVEITGK